METSKRQALPARFALLLAANESGGVRSNILLEARRLWAIPRHEGLGSSFQVPISLQSDPVGCRGGPGEGGSLCRRCAKKDEARRGRESKQRFGRDGLDVQEQKSERWRGSEWSARASERGRIECSGCCDANTAAISFDTTRAQVTRDTTTLRTLHPV